jgi:pyrroline-5-carboxylate reductase
MGERQIGIVGGGNMARAIIEGCLASGGFVAGDWAVAEPDPAKLAAMRALGVEAVEHANELASVLAKDAPILLAVKPQSLADVAADLAGAASGRVIITILAGTPSSKVRDALGADCRVVRVMPNTPAQIGRATSAITLGAGARPGDDKLAERIFSAIGTVVRIDESLMDAFTAVAGSGPAYVFFLAEAMVEAAHRVGFAPDVAEAIVRSTLAGSSLLLEGSEKSAADLRRAVTSKGGTTEAALAVLDRTGVLESVVEAIVAARDRGTHLAGPGPSPGRGAS